MAPAEIGQVGHSVQAAGQGQGFGQAEGQGGIVGPGAGGLAVGAVAAHSGHEVGTAAGAVFELHGHAQGVAHAQAQQGGAAGSVSRHNSALEAAQTRPAAK